MYSPKSIFKNLEKQAVSENNGEAVKSNNFDSNLLKFKQGCSYTLRLLWLAPDGTQREHPMINQYTHRIWDENAIGSKDVKVICRTSQYDMGESKSGFDACPICRKIAKLYKEGSQGSASAMEVYNKFRRTFYGYVPVYVVNGPAEDVNKVKILRYPKTFRDFFDSKIFGLKTKNSTDSIVDSNDETIGIDAFMYYDPVEKEIHTSGYNLLVNVGTKKVPVGPTKKQVDMPTYSIDFSRKPTVISELDGNEITEEYFGNLSKEIGFDRDYFKFSTDEELEEFLAKYINGEMGAVLNTAPAKQEKPVVVEDDGIDVEDEDIPSVKSDTKAEPVSESAKTEDDIEDLLKDI